MKILTSVTLAAICFGAAVNANAMDGHNGIHFNMKQKDVEAKGFVCNPPKEPQKHILAVCKHMDMTGVAFGFPTKDYNLVIGASGKVDKIGAEFSNPISMADYFSLHPKIEHFFPQKYEAGSKHADSVIRDEWRAKNNSAAVLMYFKGVPSITNSSLRISFWSQRAMAEAEKNKSDAEKVTQ